MALFSDTTLLRTHTSNIKAPHDALVRILQYQEAQKHTAAYLEFKNAGTGSDEDIAGRTIWTNLEGERKPKYIERYGTKSLGWMNEQ